MSDDEIKQIRVSSEDEDGPQVDPQTKARRAYSRLVDRVQEIRHLEALFESELGEAWAEYKSMTRELEELQEEAKAALRDCGSGTHSFGGTRIRLGTARKKREIKRDQLISRATERDDLSTLLEAGVLEYKVNADQILRLPSRLKVIYASYVTEEDGTITVRLPAEAKL